MNEMFTFENMNFMLHFCEDVQRSLCLLTATHTGNVKTSRNPSDGIFLLAQISILFVLSNTFVLILMILQPPSGC